MFYVINNFFIIIFFFIFIYLFLFYLFIYLFFFFGGGGGGGCPISVLNILNLQHKSVQLLYQTGNRNNHHKSNIMYITQNRSTSCTSDSTVNIKTIPR